MITILSSEKVDEEFLANLFIVVLDATLLFYKKDPGIDFEPMGSREEMERKLPEIAGCILRACKTYYDTPEEQLVQIISAISINHYLSNGNKRTAVSAGALYLNSYAAEIYKDNYLEGPEWVISKIENLKYIADIFAKAVQNNSGNENYDAIKDEMYTYAKTNIFNK